MVMAQVVMGAVLMGAVPWAFRVHGRLCGIDAHLEMLAKQDLALAEVYKRLNRLEMRVSAASGKANGDHE